MAGVTWDENPPRSPKDLLDDYPELEPEDIQAALLYAAELVSEVIVQRPLTLRRYEEIGFL